MSTPRLFAVILAVGQLVSPLFFFLGDALRETGAAGEPPIVPAGYTFAIWAVICVLSVAYAVWALPARGADEADLRVRDALARPLAGVFAGYSLWLVVASAEATTWATVPIFATMLALLLWALRIARAERAR